MPELRFDNKVVVVTGAGGGIGKAYALFFASRGASVVVNDLGGSFKGEGSNSRAADLVVDEIKKNGGKAVANYDSVEFGDKIIQTAVNSFGTIHILINNAGILRDISLKNMTDKDWDLITAVHLKGAYKTTRAAWPYFRKQKFGRVINITSSSGLYGSFGQANYSAAKLALVGFSESLAKEGYKYNINVNAVTPTAASRMTETIMPEQFLAKLSPDYIVPLVAFLTHESTRETGSIYEAGGGYVGKIRWQRANGAILKTDDSLTPSAIQARWKDITDFTKSTYPDGPNNFLELLDQAKHHQSNPQGDKIDFTGKVAVVTGAGGGLGRTYALLLAKLGAKIVVNDLANPDNTVSEIKKLGGVAVADNHSVEEGDAVIKTAIDNFGAVHILINNAGILRDKSFSNMTDEQWDFVLRVHLRGTYKMTKAAWPYFLKQKYGRIVNTASTSGIYGNFGQANYAAAKLGIFGFTKTVALEGKKYNIIANTIAPNAGTAMTATIMPPEIVKAFKPDFVAPTTVFLVSDKVPVTGDLFEIGCGWTGQTRWESSGGYFFNHKFTPEEVAQHWSEITEFGAKATHPKFSNESNGSKILGRELSKHAKDAAQKKAENFKPKPVVAQSHELNYTHKDIILYNLGIGAKVDTDLNLVYEGDENFTAVPTFGIVPSYHVHINAADLLPNFNYKMLLHGEEFLEIYKWPIPESGTLVTTPSLVEVVDKGKAGILISRSVSKLKETGEVLFKCESTAFVRGSGGFGGKTQITDRGAATAPNTPPKRDPDFVASEKISPDLAAIYRLSGDYNPLHIDPQSAAISKFPKPILHGLATFGISGKMLFKKYGFYKNIKVRFTNVVFPGETLKVEAWKEGNKVIFQTRVVERNVIAISAAAIELGSDVAKL